MFQKFEDIPAGGGAAERLPLLRAELKRQGVTGFFLPRSDEFMNEYVPESAERLRWLTGFSGSAGFAIILPKQAALFVDGRYTLQAGTQVDASLIQVLQKPRSRARDWLASRLTAADRIGYDPRVHGIGEVEHLQRAIRDTGATLVPLESNPVDAVWKDRPEPPLGPIVPHERKYAGKPAPEKIADLRTALKEADQDACVLALPESVAWLLNIRGSDVPHTPLPLVQAIVRAAGPVELFADPRKVPAKTAKWLGNDVRVLPPGELPARLAALARKTVRLDADTVPSWFAMQLEQAGAKVVRAADPCLLPKARKNPAEIAGTKAAHRRDGMAMCRFLAWLDREAPKGKVDEISAARQLEDFRAETGKLKEISFDTISGAGPNGAIVHYRVTRSSNRKLKRGQLYLVDSGA
ncbi:MAG: aminopeptidase P family N-terminal domain-containing protein, partial [Hyphomicrobiales bacterium]